jgi:hypothetical protein
VKEIRRRELEQRLLAEIRAAREEYGKAVIHAAEVLEQQPEMPQSDGAFAMGLSIRLETAALRRYDRALKAYAAFVRTYQTPQS